MFKNLKGKNKIIIFIIYLLIILIGGFFLRFCLMSSVFKGYEERIKNSSSISSNELKTINTEQNKDLSDVDEDDKLSAKQELDKITKKNNSNELPVEKKEPLAKNNAPKTSNDDFNYDVYNVGTDLNSGIYKLISTSDEKTGYCKISKVVNGNPESFYDNLFINSTYVYLKDGDSLAVLDCEVVPSDSVEFSKNNILSPGGYMAGVDIPIGTYSIKKENSNSTPYVEICDIMSLYDDSHKNTFKKIAVSGVIQISLNKNQCLNVSAGDIIIKKL